MALDFSLDMSLPDKAGGRHAGRVDVLAPASTPRRNRRPAMARALGATLLVNLVAVGAILFVGIATVRAADAQQIGQPAAAQILDFTR